MSRIFKLFSLTVILLAILMIPGCNKENNESKEADNAQKYIEEEYNLKVSTGNIYGTLMMPKDVDSSTVALIIAGSGPTDRNGNNPGAGENNSLKMIAEALASEGISSVRYDKRGIGESKDLVKKEEELVFEDYINDAINWVNKLREDERFNKVVIIGHSEGALIGAVAAYKADVDGFVSVAGMGYSAYDTLSRQLKAQSEEVYELCLPIMDELMNGNLVDDVPEGLYSLFRPSVQPYLISWFKYNPIEEISKIDKPVLILQGDTDLQVTVEDAKLLHEANSNSKLVIINGMNHILKDAPEDRQTNLATYSNPDLPLNKQFVKEITTFIKEL